MASVAMAVEGMARLSLSSTSTVAFPSTKTIFSFNEFSGLASVRKTSFSSSCSSSLLSSPATTTTSFVPVLPSRRAVIWSAPLRIEARQPTRKETVKVRHRRIRKKLNGTSERPRLAVFRSNKHLYAQVIDDTKQHTLAASSTLMKPVREELQFSSGPTVDAAKKVGEEIAKACLEKGITMVAFDRGGFVYHGRIRALADAARDGGLSF